MMPETYNHIIKYLRGLIQDTEFERCTYAVGGCVRDIMLEDEPHDIDLCVEMCNGGFRLADYFFKRGFLESEPVYFERYGVAQVRLKEFLDYPIDIVQTRKELYTYGSRKPETTYGTIKEDAFRRDLTMNALYQEIWSGNIIDPTGCGIHDIMNKVLMTTSSPDEIFIDDPLRILRVIRFYLRMDYDWKIEPVVEQALSKYAKELVNISSERIVDELRKMFVHPKSCIHSIIRLLQKYGVLEYCMFHSVSPLDDSSRKIFMKHFQRYYEATPPVLPYIPSAGISESNKVIRYMSYMLYVMYNMNPMDSDLVKLIMKPKWPNEIVYGVCKVFECMHSQTLFMNLDEIQSSDNIISQLHLLQNQCGNADVYGNLKWLLYAVWNTTPLSKYFTYMDIFKSAHERYPLGYQYKVYKTGNDVMTDTGITKGFTIGVILNEIKHRRLLLHDINDEYQANVIYNQVIKEFTICRPPK